MANILISLVCTESHFRYSCTARFQVEVSTPIFSPPFVIQCACERGFDCTDIFSYGHLQFMLQ
jgi:hypothetical protein